MDWDDFVAEFDETAADGYVAARDILGNLEPGCEVYDRAQAFLAVVGEFEAFLEDSGLRLAN